MDAYGSRGDAVEMHQRMNEVCDAFEGAFRSGHRPRIESLIEGLSGRSRGILLADLLAMEIQLREEIGERPDRSEYVGRFPQDSEPIARAFERATPDPFPGEYRFIKCLGEGAFGAVWQAEDLGLDRLVALKTFRGQSRSPEGRQALAALEREARILARMEHEHIVRVHAWRRTGSTCYLVMEYVEGGSFAARLRESGRLSWKDAARHICDVGDALQMAHRRGVVHRDIKPANILWDRRNDRAKLTDFGVSAHLAEVGTIGGTPPYMAPEADEGMISEKLDVFGLAATLYDLATGQVPFPGPDAAACRRAKLQGLGQSDPLHGPDVVPPKLLEAIRIGLAPEPGERPGLRPFMAKLRGTLNGLLADDCAVLDPPGPTSSLSMVLSRRADDGQYREVAMTRVGLYRALRDMRLTPPAPERAMLRTGDRVRVEVVSDRDGHLTVFNLGPTGNLNLLYPVIPGAIVPAGRPVRILDVTMTPPAGCERLLAVWTRDALPFRPEELRSVAEMEPSEGSPSRAVLATGDINRVRGTLEGLDARGRAVVILEIDHRPA